MNKKDPWEYYTKVMKAISEQTRLKIMWLLCNIDSKICSSEIAEVLNENPYNISRHIKVLKNANLVSEKKEGIWIYYYSNLEENDFEKAVKRMIMKVPPNMMVEEVKRCKTCIKRRNQ